MNATTNITDKDIRRVEAEGYDAYRAGIEVNPYRDPERQEAWQRGYNRAVRDKEAARNKWG